MAKRRIFKVCQNCPGRKLRENPENYILIPKKKLMEKLAEIKLYGTKINGQLSDKPEYSPRYLADFIEKELLRKNARDE